MLYSKQRSPATSEVQESFYSCFSRVEKLLNCGAKQNSRSVCDLTAIMTYWADNIKFIKDCLDSKYKKIEDSLLDLRSSQMYTTKYCTRLSVDLRIIFITMQVSKDILRMIRAERERLLQQQHSKVQLPCLHPFWRFVLVHAKLPKLTLFESICSMFRVVPNLETMPSTCKIVKNDSFGVNLQPF